MKLQPYNLFDNTFRPLSAIILVLLAAFLIAPNALAGRCFDKDGNLKPHAKPSCTPDHFPVDDSFNQAMFDDAYIAVAPQAFTRGNPNFDRGDYLADNPGSNGVWISTDSLSKTTLKGKRDSDLCHILDKSKNSNVPFFGYPDTFSYGWTDDCRDTECEVEISLSFEDGPILDLTDGRSDRLELVMFATATGLEQGQFEPFTTPQALAINSIGIEYNKAGTTRALVQCRLGPQGEGGPELFTVPTP
jgi:hypothetical protein